MFYRPYVTVMFASKKSLNLYAGKTFGPFDIRILRQFLNLGLTTKYTYPDLT